MHTRLGMPIYDVDSLSSSEQRESQRPHGPEATNLTLAERIKKDMLLSVFSQDVSDAHMNGDIHLHDLGFVDRPYCRGQSLEYIKKFGLNLLHSLSMAKPAKHPEVLFPHLVEFAAGLQSNFAGAIGWDAINIFFAPYLVEISDNEVKQLAQMLIFEFSPAGGGKGGQAIFTDIDLYQEIPEAFRRRSCHRTGRDVYGQKLRGVWERGRALRLEAFRGVQRGRRGEPYLPFPEALVHITEKCFKTEDHEKFSIISATWPVTGNTYFVFDREIPPNIRVLPPFLSNSTSSTF